jgi:hypothetical protein
MAEKNDELHATPSNLQWLRSWFTSKPVRQTMTALKDKEQVSDMGLFRQDRARQRTRAKLKDDSKDGGRESGKTRRRIAGLTE